MIHSRIVICSALLILSSCSVRTNSVNDQKGEVADTANNQISLTESLTTKMTVKDTIRAGEAIDLNFSVSNKSKMVFQFCKWHTPFEPLMSKYLEIRDENGKEINYLGAMAKRSMPPPVSSFIQIKPGEQISGTVDLAKAYDIKEPSRYFVSYSSQDISGLRISESVSFVLTR